MKIRELMFTNTDGNPHTYVVGIHCSNIIEHRAAGEGDKWFYDIVTDKEVVRIFYPLQVIFEKE